MSQGDPPATGGASGGATSGGGGGGSNQDLVGTTLANRYTIEAELGRGGMGAVYRAIDRNLNTPVVVKVPHPHMLLDETFRLRFNQEVQSLTRSPHPAVVRIQDYGDHGGQPFFVVEFKGGGDLEHRFERDGLLEPEQVLEWLPSIAAALDSIHDRGTLHRDIKPANILFDQDGNPCLADFGIATVMGAASSDAETVAPSVALTAENRFIGSPAYAPPEAIDRLFTGAYDQYSLGVVVYEALCGRRPFEADTPERVIALKQMQDPTPIGQYRRDLGAGIERAVMRTLAREPDGRFPSCRDFAEAFRVATEARAARPPAGGRRTPALAALLVGVLLLAGAGYWWTQQGATGSLPADPPSGTSPADPGVKPPGTGASPTPVTYRLGSTPEEFNQAMDLCEQTLGEGECDGDDYVTEIPREVTLVLPRFDPHPVTVEEFADFAEREGYRTVAERQGSSYDGPLRTAGLSWKAAVEPGRPTPRDRALPVRHLAREDARAYCQATGGRLPTAEEWEAAARGAESRVFPWGSAWKPSASDWDVDAPAPQPVGSFPEGRTPDGLSDMAGGVWEWTDDTRQTSDGALGVLKGGAWRSRSPADLRAAAEAEVPPGDPDAEMGVRCVR